MKRKIFVAALLLAIALAFAQSAAQNVYVTANGKKYHAKYCRTIKNSTLTELTVDEAKKASYTPCKVCAP